MKRRGGMKTRSRRGRLSVRKTRSQRERKSQRKSQRKQQRGGNFIQDTLGVPKGSTITVNTLGEDPEESIAPYVTIYEEEGAPTAKEVA